MNPTVQAAIDRELAELERLVPQPVEPFGYGNDLSCVNDLTEDLAEVDPDSVRGIGEAAVRRLTTSRGSLLDDPDYGLDVRMYCNRGTTVAELRELGGRCSLELVKDDRLLDARVSATLDASGKTLTISAVLTPANPTLTPFTLTFAVTSGKVVLEAIG